MYTYYTLITLRDTDSAGWLYFASYFTLAHEAYERYLDSVNMNLHHFVHKATYLPPVVHAEADFKKTLSLSEKVRIEIKAENIGKSSYTLSYALKKASGRTAATIRIIYA